MIDAKDIESLMKKCEITKFDIENLDGGRIFAVERNSVQSCIAEWSEIQRFLTDHRKVIMKAGNKNTGRQKGVARYVWEIFFENDGRQQQKNNYYGAMAGFGFDNHPMLQMKMKALEMQNEINNLKKGGGGDSDDKWIGVLSGLLPEIFKKDKGSALNGPNDLGTFEDEKDEAIKRLEELMGRVCKKVSIKKIIKLLEAVEKNPKLADKALNFLA